MAETKFTPGPWEAAQIHSNGNWLSMIVGDCKPIAEVNCDCLEASNAHLIAAAPELYAALERLLRSLDDIKFDDEFYAALQASKEALAKARGETQ